MTWRDGWDGAVGTGWEELVDGLDAKVLELAPDRRIDQIKEKFGGLRYYVSNIPEDVWDEVYDVIGEAEARSLRTCEDCGGPGTTGPVRPKGYWVLTLCEECRRKPR